MHKNNLMFKVINRKKIHFELTLEQIRQFPFPYLSHFEYSYVIVNFEYRATDNINIEDFKLLAIKQLKKQYKAYQVLFIEQQTKVRDY